tara:strand:- start:2752 stop:5100 length:2349 start_codon:yes stop_codon:yes gene_type:complete
MVNARINDLYNGNFALVNLKLNEKLPIHTGYMRDEPNVLLGKFQLNDGNVAIRMGNNTLNSRWVIGLDFDCSTKNKKGIYEDCKNTILLKETYKNNIDCEDGMYQSSTEGNMNVLVDITNSYDLQEAIKVLPNRWSSTDANLELLTGCIMVLPPSITPNKKTGKLGEKRVWYNDKNMYKVEDNDDPIVSFIVDYINDNPSKSKKKYQSKKDTEFDFIIEENHSLSQSIIHPNNFKLTEKILTTPSMKKLFDDYDTWWKLGYAIYNIHGYDGKDIFIKCSKTKSYPNENVKAYWEAIDAFLKDKDNRKKYSLWNDIWLFNIIKHTDIDLFKEYYIEALRFKKDREYFVDKVKFENIEGDYRVCKISYKGMNYTLWNKATKSLDITEWDKVKHTCLEEFGKSFLETWFEDKQKEKVDDVNIYPYGGTPKNCINLFTGFPLHNVMKTKTEKGWSPNQDYISHFKEYVRRVCGKEEVKASHFLTQFIAHILHKGRPKICLVIRGKPGCGKGSFVSLIKGLIGTEYWIDDPQGKRVFSRFNAQFQNKLLVCIDEPDWASTANQIEDFKNRITEPTLTIEKKGIDAYELDNWITFMMTTNNKNLFKLTKDDRRFFFLNMDAFDGTKDDKNAYFNDFYNYLNNEEYMCSVLYYLKEILDENYCFEIQREIAMTTYQKILTGAFDESDPLPFLKEYIKRDDLNIYVKDGNEWIEKLRSINDNVFYLSEDEIYNDYKMYCRDIKPMSKINVKQEISILQGEKCELRASVGDTRMILWNIDVGVLMKGLENS